jgi:hypothetical protein
MAYYFIRFPINNSTWDKAFELCGNPSCGFDFETSPFGDDYFDLFPDFGKKDNICYQDIYTGYVYYIPFTKFEEKSGIPYALDNYRDELKRKHYLGYGDSSRIESEIKYYERGEQQVKHLSDFKSNFYGLNYEIVSSICLLIIGGFISVINLIVILLKKSRH